jgi:hypothetical protein
MVVNKIVLSDENIDVKERISLINQVYYNLQDLQNEYPDFYEWYYFKVVPQITVGKRNISIVRYGAEIAGLVITKNDLEKKICTLRVNKKYQKSGVGKILFEDTFDILETEKPIITVSEGRVFEFRRIFSYYGFNLEKVYNNYYKTNQAELSFNGLLNKKMDIYLQQSNVEKKLAL